MSRLTRTGLWLLPWLPLTIVILLVLDLFRSSHLLIDDAPYTRAQLVWNVIYNLVLWPSFGFGVILLVIAGIRRLARLSRGSA